MFIDIENMALEVKIGQLLLASIDRLSLDEQAEAFLTENYIGNIIHYGNSARDREQITAYNKVLHQRILDHTGIAPLISIDHEGGRMFRFRDGFTVFPSAMAISATENENNARIMGRATAEELRAAGFSLNLAPDLDVNTNPHNPVIGVRAYGDEPARVSRYGTAMVDGTQEAGMMACGKHFPGHGDTEVDSHFGLPSVNRSMEMLERIELYPYFKPIRHGIASIMTSHILFPQIDPDPVPATMSPFILQNLLREKMGFDGLIISDSMQMQAITDEYGIEQGCVEAVKAGVDLLCVGTGMRTVIDSQASCFRALLKAAQTGEIPMQRIDDAVRRIMAAKARYCVPFEGTVDWEANAAQARQMAEDSITWVSGGCAPLEGRILNVSMKDEDDRFGIFEGDWRARSFAGIATSILGGRSLVLDEDTDYDVLLDADTVVIGISSARDMEMQFIQEALWRRKHVRVVLLDMPYAVLRLPADCPTLCTYGPAEVSVQAACRVLCGEVQAKGKLPVQV